MRFHVLLPGCVHTPAITQPWEPHLTGSDIIRIAQAADECGFESLLVPEHFMITANHAEASGRHFLDATTAQAVMAGATKRIKLGSMVTLVPLHDPVILAKSVCILDWLSGGRAALTAGLGWQREEYDALGVPWQERGARADEYLAALLELWHSDAPQFDGKFESFKDIVFEPKLAELSLRTALCAAGGAADTRWGPRRKPRQPDHHRGPPRRGKLRRLCGRQSRVDRLHPGDRRGAGRRTHPRQCRSAGYHFQRKQRQRLCLPTCSPKWHKLPS